MVISELESLQHLHLIDAGIDCDTMLELCNGLRDSSSMEYLDLRHNIFDAKGLAELIRALGQHMSVKHLYLESLPIDHSEARMLADFFAQDTCLIEELELNEADFDIESLDIIMEALYMADHLRRLSLSKNILTTNICEHLAKMPTSLHSFESLCLSHCEICEDGLELLCSGFYGKTTIKYLDLSWNNIQANGMKIILKMLQHNKSLEKLLIQHNFLGSEGAK